MKPPFLNGSRSSVRLRVPSGKIRNELPARIDRAPGFDRAHRGFLVAAVDGNEAAEPERARQDRDPVDLVLVEDVHARVQRLEQDRRVDVALVIRAVDGGAVERQVLACRRRGSGCRSGQSQPHAAVAEDSTAGPSSRTAMASSMPSGPTIEDVEGDGDVGGDGADGGDDHGQRIINEKARRRFELPAGSMSSRRLRESRVESTTRGPHDARAARRAARRGAARAAQP